MSGSREEILANFQECTGISNIEEAIMWLQASNWDLQTAIECAVSHNMYGEDTQPAVSISNDFIAVPSTSQPVRILTLNVHFQANIYKLQVPESLTIGCVKTLIQSETRVPPCKQVISGWASNPPTTAITDETPLTKLKLPDSIDLFVKSGFDLVATMNVGSVLDAELKKQINNHDTSKPSGSKGRVRRAFEINLPMDESSSEPTVCLKILDGNKNVEHSLIVPVSQKVGDVKKSISTRTGITLPQQTWLGWPDHVTDSMELSKLKLEKPVHHLTVVKLEGSPEPRKKSRTSVPRFTPSPGPSDSGAESEGFAESFSAEEEIFTEETTPSNRIAPLMPDNTDDETNGSVSFIDGYTLRYGQNSPNFFSGTLERAMNEAFAKTGRDRRMLALYVHHDGSILTNVFCSELLGSESILQIFSTYFVLWGWDITNRRNRDMLLDSVAQYLGQTVLQAITNIKTDDFPALVIVSRLRSSIQLLDVIRGNIGANELLNKLVNTIDIFTEKLEADIQNEEERAARDRIKYEQDMAYQESLILDKAKEESRKQQQILESLEAQRLKQEEEKREAEKNSIKSQLPEEPSESTSPKEVMTFRFRTPTGEFFLRRFWLSDTLQTLFDYLLVKGFRVDEFKVISPWPRKDLSTLEGASLLKDVGLCTQETLTLEER